MILLPCFLKLYKVSGWILKYMFSPRRETAGLILQGIEYVLITRVDSYHSRLHIHPYLPLDVRVRNERARTERERPASMDLHCHHSHNLYRGADVLVDSLSMAAYPLLTSINWP